MASLIFVLFFQRAKALLALHPIRVAKRVILNFLKLIFFGDDLYLL